MGDPLLKAKLQFFVRVAGEIQPFLQLYQTDRPMIPFLATDLASLVKDLMKRFVKPSVMAGAKTIAAVCSIDYSNQDNQVDTSKVDIGFSSTRSLLSTKGAAHDRTKHNFRHECKQFLMATVKKILEKSPTAYPLMRNLEWLDPRNIAKSPVDETEKRTWKASMDSQLRKVMSILCDSGRLDERSGEVVRKQFVQFNESGS